MTWHGWWGTHQNLNIKLNKNIENKKPNKRDDVCQEFYQKSINEFPRLVEIF